MKFTIRMKMILSSSLLILTIIVISLISLMTLNSVNNTLDYSVSVKFPNYGLIRDAAVDIHQALIAERELLYFKKDGDQYKDSLKTYNKNIGQSQERIDTIDIERLTPDEKKLMDEYLKYRSLWLTQSSKVISFVEKEDTESAIRLSLGNSYKAFEAMEEALDAVGDGIKDEMETLKLEQLKEIQSRITLVFIVIVAGLTISIILGIIISKSILDKIFKIRDRINKISQGNGDLTAHIDVKGRDEIAQLATGFNVFISKLHTIVVKSKEESRKLIDIKSSLGNLTEETAAAVYEIDANINSIKDMVKDLTLKVENADTSLNSMLESKTSLDQDISRESESISNSLESISQMLTSIESVEEITNLKEEIAKQLVGTSSYGGEKLTTTTEHVENINGTIESISELVTLINSVSDSTNLLAMNAAIEAAHAGDAGKGFSVVADEIRKLAESSSTSAKGIKDVIERVLESIKLAYSSGKEADDAFQEIKKEVSEVAKAFRDISSSSSLLTSKGDAIKSDIVNLSKLSDSVQDSTNKMESYTKSVINNISDLNRLSTEVEGSILEISNGTNQITLAMGEVKDLTTEMSESSEALHREIGNFKTE